MTPQEKWISEARRWIGTPYQHQASMRDVGCDCLGLIRGIWRACEGKEPEVMPAYTPDWAEAGGQELLVEAAGRYFTPIPKDTFDAGDILLFRWREGGLVKHAGLATSPTHMIHAHDGACVCEVAIVPMWRRRLSHAFRLKGEWPKAVIASA